MPRPDNDHVAPTQALTPTDEARADGQPLPRRTVKLGQGIVVPYPEPLNAATTKVAKANRRKDTKPEVQLRSVLHRQGIRFRKDHLLRCGDVKVRPDIVFTKAKIAVFVDGCFWHGCPQHQNIPKRNPDYWVPKLQRNVDRDRRADAALTAAGWDVIRIWEHEDMQEAANRVTTALQARNDPAKHPQARITTSSRPNEARCPT